MLSTWELKLYGKGVACMKKLIAIRADIETHRGLKILCGITGFTMGELLGVLVEDGLEAMRQVTRVVDLVSKSERELDHSSRVVDLVSKRERRSDHRVDRKAKKRNRGF